MNEITELERLEQLSQISMTYRWGSMSHPRKQDNDHQRHVRRLHNRKWTKTMELFIHGNPPPHLSKTVRVYGYGRSPKAAIRKLRNQLNITSRVTYLRTTP